MLQLRRLVLTHRYLAGIPFALALVMKIVVPSGFMPTFATGEILVSICSGIGPKTTTIIVPGFAQKSGGERHQGKAEQPCAFFGLSAPSLAAVDPILLVAAILFILSLGMQQSVLPVPCARPYLRPPLRGPPLL